MGRRGGGTGIGAGLALACLLGWGTPARAVDAPVGDAAPVTWDARRPDSEVRLFDARFEPIALVRTLFVTTFEDTVRSETSGGEPLDIHSSRMDPSPFGHREGFVLDNVELGMFGRFDEAGLYYKTKFELVPREKDGNRSTDWLKDAYFGWDRYRIFDVRGGRMKIPFSQANLRHTGDHLLIQKPVLDTLIPKRQLGAALGFADPWGVVTLRGGVFNSVKSAVEQMKSLDQLLYVARLEVRLENLFDALAVDAAGLAVRLGGNIAWTERSFDPETEHRWVGADLHVSWWRLTLEGEIAIVDFFRPPDLDGAQKADRGWGWHVDLAMDLWPEGLRVVGRVEQYEGDDIERGASTTLSIDELSRQKKLWVTAGLSYRYAERARVDVNYVHRREEEGFEFDNDVVLVMLQFDL